MYLPLFLCLYESFWKGFEFDQRRLTLLVVKCVSLSGPSPLSKRLEQAKYCFKTFPRSSPKEIES